jgi:pimeloyl-ACP methyl ester carboxylesterase
MSERDAIIYIPGLFHEPGESVNVVGRNIAAALDSKSPPEFKYTLSPGKDEYYGYGERATRTVTIARKSAAQETPLIDIYELSYGHTLTDGYEKSKPIAQAFSILLSLLWNLPRLVRAIRMPSKDFTQKLQVAYAGLITLLLGAYMVLLLFTVVATLGDTAITQAPSNEATVGIEESTGLGDATGDAKETPWWLYYPQVAVICLTGLGLLTKLDAKQFLSRFSTWYVGAVTYLDQGRSRDNVVGQLNSLLEYIAEKQSEVKYKKVHIIGYSFGSIVAIDAMLPQNEPSDRYRTVDTLVTIGCPFDFIRTYWPTYFEQRVALDGVPRRWLNIYRAADVLGSNFEDEDKSGSTERGVGLKGEPLPKRPENMMLGGDGGTDKLAALRLIGFREHSCYWFDEPYASDAFDLAVERIYGDDEALR